jgi:mycofactocin precursor
MSETTTPAAGAPVRERTSADGAPEAGAPEVTAAPVTALVEADLLVEDVSIDGMCGVY